LQLRETHGLEPFRVGRTESGQEPAKERRRRRTDAEFPAVHGGTRAFKPLGELVDGEPACLSEVPQHVAQHGALHSRGEGSHGEWRRARVAMSDSHREVQMEQLRERLRVARQRAGLTVEQVATLVGRTQSVVSRWETGKAKMPDFDTVVKWAGVVGLRLHAEERRDDDPFDALRAMMTDEDARRLVAALSVVKKVS
jgi:ribosome-binding protein aMBF1 (putative translation factor)